MKSDCKDKIKKREEKSKKKRGRISRFMAEDAQEGQGGGQERIAEGGQDKVNGCQSRVVFPSTPPVHCIYIQFKN